MYAMPLTFQEETYMYILYIQNYRHLEKLKKKMISLVSNLTFPHGIICKMQYWLSVSCEL